MDGNERKVAIIDICAIVADEEKAKELFDAVEEQIRKFSKIGDWEYRFKVEDS